MPKNQSIIIFSTAYLPMLGGAELAVKEITDRVSDYDFFMVTARLRHSYPRVEHIGNVEVHRFGLGLAPLDKMVSPFLGAWWARRFAREHHIQCFWSVMVSFTSLAPFLLKAAGLHRGIPILLTLQEGDSEHHIMRGRFGLIRASWELALSYADQVQVISAYLEGLARAFGYAGPVTVIPNGVDVEKFKIKKSKLKNPQNPTIITTSRLVPKNGIDILIRAMPNVVHKIPKVRCILVGDGSERKHLERLADELHVAKHVEFVGAVPHADIPGYLWRATVFVRPARSEGLGTSFLEAMAAGLPIIATPVGGIEDFLHDGETGLYSHVEDPEHLASRIIEVCTNQTLSRRLATTGQKLMEERFTWESVTRRMQKLFASFSNQ